MKKEEKEKLQEELIGIISCIPVSSEDSHDKDRALEIIQILGRSHINDIILYGSKEGTILDLIIESDSVPDLKSDHATAMECNISTQNSHKTRLNNKTLVELEKSVKSFGGKCSEDLKSPSERIINKAKHGVNTGVYVAIMVLKAIAVIVVTVFVVIGGIIGAIVGAAIGVVAEIKTGVSLLASKVRSDFQNTTVEPAEVNEEHSNLSHAPQ